MDIIFNLMVVTLMGLVAIIAGIFEDLESDVASTSNPNSQVQLASEVGNLHKFFNRAISGEPLLVGTMATISGTVCHVLLSLNQPVLLSLIISAVIASMVQLVLSITSYMGRITSQALYNQPIFMDVLYKHIPTMVAHAFITLFSITLLSYLMVYVMNSQLPLTLPLVTLLLGITLGSVGSAVGDIHYGAEKLYQTEKFGAGIPVSLNGQISTISSIGTNSSIDVVKFCSKFAGPLTGLCFGIIIFLSFWQSLIFGVKLGLIVGFIIIILITVLNGFLEYNSRKKYGKFKKE